MGHHPHERIPRCAISPLREIFALAPLAVFIFWIGLYPKYFLDRMQPTLNPIAAAASRKLDMPQAA